MPISLTCGSCGVLIRAPEGAAGKSTTCPKCRAMIRIPVAAPGPSDAVVAAPDDPGTWVAAPPPPLNVVRVEPAPPTRRRDDDFDDEPERPSRRSRRRRFVDDGIGFKCPFCNSDAPPVTHSKISTAGWIMFLLLLLLICLPLCWIGLLMKEDYRVCRDCGMKLG